MNIKDIKALASVLQQADLTALDYSEGDMHIRLERNAPKLAVTVPQTLGEPVNLPAPVEEKNDFNNLSEVKSPMVGVFYAAPEPGGKPFVKVGDRVNKGDVMCIVEAMKLNNEIAADKDGEVVDICVTDGSVVEYGQTLFKVF